MNLAHAQETTSPENRKASIDPETSTVSYKKIGDVIMIKGKVVKISNNNDEETSVSQGSSFSTGDAVKTKENGVIKIKMLDDTILSLGPNSIFQFKKFDFKNPSERESVYGLLVGQLRAKFENKAKNPDDLKINTRATVMAIRGTELLTNVKPREDGKVVTEIALIKGSLDIKNNASGAVINLKPKEHYVTFTDFKASSVYDEGVVDLPLDVYERLIKDVSNENIAAFLEYYKGEKVSANGASRGPSSVGQIEYEAPKLKNKKRESQGADWRNKMFELNNRLKDYNEK
jgi:hypothetical protein